MTGPDRAILYRVAAGTGFRASECRSLTPASFRVDDDPPTIALWAASSKRRRDDVQPIRVDLANLLRGWLAGRAADAPVFASMPERTAVMIRADLRRAKAGWIRGTRDRLERQKRRDAEFLAEIDNAGRVVDFHSLRATYVTLLIKGGASVKAVQELARHSDPKLTLNVYSQLGVHDLAGAIAKLPAVTSKPPQRERLRATGTENAHAKARADPRPKPRQLGRESRQLSAASRNGDAGPAALADARKPFRIANVSGPMQQSAADRTQDATVAQLAEQRFCKPQVGGSSPLGGFPASLQAGRPYETPLGSPRVSAPGLSLADMSQAM